MDKVRIVIWGTGNLEKSIDPYILKTVEIAAFVDNDETNWNTYVCRNGGDGYQEIQICRPDILRELEYDYILIASNSCKEIEKQCIDEYQIPREKLIQTANIENNDLDVLNTIFDMNILGDNNYYKIDGKSIKFGEKHDLPKYQRKFPMYDRFLPYLADITRKKAGHWILDIGANVGDTVMAMCDHTSDQFLCIEPERHFYDLLVNNLKAIDNNRVLVEQAFITDDVKEKFIANIYMNGTAVKRKIMEGDVRGANAPSKTIDAILNEKGIEVSMLDLIKIDTDGFDSDCIMSAKNTLYSGHALIYWENEIMNYGQYFRYQLAYTLLAQMGYNTFFIFDNTGNYLCKGTIDIVQSITGYLQRVNEGWSRVTFDYIDVLGCKDDDVDKCERAIEKYSSQFILRRRK